MKRFLFLLFVNCFVLVSAQTESQLKKHYKDDIIDLDPIEGIYDAEAVVSQSNTRETEKGTFKMYIHI